MDHLSTNKYTTNKLGYNSFYFLVSPYSYVFFKNPGISNMRDF